MRQIEQLDIRRIRWHYIHTRKRSPWYVFSIFLGFSAQTVNMDGFRYWIRRSGEIDDRVVVDERDWEMMRRRLLRKLKLEPGFLLKQMRNSYRVHDELRRYCQSIFRRKKLSTLTNIELAELVDGFLWRIQEAAAYGLLPLFVETELSNYIAGELKRFSGDFEEKYSLVMTPVKTGRVMQEKMSLLRLAKRYRQGGLVAIKKDLQKHVEKFSWMKNAGYFTRFVSEGEYLRRLRQVAKQNPDQAIVSLLAERRLHARQYRLLLKKVRHNARLKITIETMNEAIFFRSFRSEEYFRTSIYLTGLLKAVAQRINLDHYEDVLYLFPSEVSKLLRKNAAADPRLIRRRKQSYALISDGENYFTCAGDKAVELGAIIRQREISSKKLSGQSAFPGIVQGLVVIVLSHHDFRKVKSGSILIARSTQPDYVSVLKKASAVVTEEGGVLSHASVIAREMRIPTLIGTKAATQVLKDGDRVEVDATHGTVKKL
ncbi:MAG: PEP-utilizing enzyme [bacterium]|nr:PEP-utilizing enzyme [bacterium]